MNVAVTGSDGFLGSHLVPVLKRQGHSVQPVSRRSCDLADSAQARRALAGAQAIVHLAWTGVPAEAEQDPQLHASANAGMGDSVLDAAQAAGSRRIVFASSGGMVYGAQERRPMRETDEPRPTHPYGLAKLSFERRLAAWGQRTGASVVAARVGNAYGPRPNLGKPQGLLEHALASTAAGQKLDLWGDGRQVRDFVYVGDVVEGLARLVAAPQVTGPLNVGTGVGTTLLDALELVGKTLGRRCEVRPVSTHRAGVPYNVLDCSRAAAVLGWSSTTSLPDGLMRTAASMGLAVRRPT